jgi:hypothetical protein
MRLRFSVILSTLAASTLAFGQLGPVFTPTDAFQVGYAANLTTGDSVLNLSNSGFQGPFLPYPGFTGAATIGNTCVNVYTFDPAEEEINCCACLVTPNGLNSISAVTDLISNPLTPSIPSSIVIKLVASQPSVPLTGTVATGPFNICNAAGVTPTLAGAPYTSTTGGGLASGMIAWGTTLEPLAAAGTYGVVSVDYKKEMLSTSELAALTSYCGFIQSDGSGFGICKSCQPGALSGSKAK